MNIGYVRPESLAAAIDFLDLHGPETAILAGGTDVMVDLRDGELQPKLLLDVSRLDALHGIALTSEGLSVGAAVTLNEIQASNILKQHAPALSKCAATFASLQIRSGHHWGQRCELLALWRHPAAACHPRSRGCFGIQSRRAKGTHPNDRLRPLCLRAPVQRDHRAFYPQAGPGDHFQRFSEDRSPPGLGHRQNQYGRHAASGC